MIWGKRGIALSMSQGKGFSSELLFKRDPEGIREMAV